MLSLWFDYGFPMKSLSFSYGSLMTLVTLWYPFLRFLVASSGSYQYLVRHLSYPHPDPPQRIGMKKKAVVFF